MDRPTIGHALAMSPKLLILYAPTEDSQPSIVKDIEGATKQDNTD